MRTAIDFDSTLYTVDSLATYFEQAVIHKAFCLSLIYPGKDFIKRAGIFIDSALKKIFCDDAIFTNYKVGHKIVMWGFSNAANNGEFTIAAKADNTEITVSETLVDDVSDDEHQIIRGAFIGFTTHDQDIVFNGLTFKAIPGMDSSAVDIRSSLDGDNLEVSGSYHVDGITKANILSRVYRYSFWEYFVLSWKFTGMGRFVVNQGRIGSIKFSDYKYTMTLKSNITLLSQEIGTLAIPNDRRRIDDSTWGVDLTKYTETGTVSIVSSNKTFAFTLDTPTTWPDHLTEADYNDYLDPADPDNPATGVNWYDWWFGNGILTWTSGSNDTIEYEISGYDKITWKDDPDQGLQLVIQLSQFTVFAIEVGDTFSMIPGYNRSSDQAIDKFDDIDGFDGELHAPGRSSLQPYNTVSE